VGRAWLALLEKGLVFETVHVELPTPESFKAINPRGTVPVLKIGDDLIFESNVIVEFLEDRFPGQGNTIVPKDAVQRTRIRVFLSEDFSSIVGSLYGALRSEPEKLAANLAELREALKELDVAYTAGSKTGPYFLGDQFSIADIAAVPFVDRFQHTLRAFCGFDLLAESPRLAALYNNAITRPAVKQVIQDGEFYIRAYEGYANGKPRLN